MDVSDGYYRYPRDGVKEVVDEELMESHFELQLSSENMKRNSVTAKLASEISSAFSKSAVASDARNTGNAMLNFTDKRKEPITSDSCSQLLGTITVKKNMVIEG